MSVTKYYKIRKKDVWPPEYREAGVYDRWGKQGKVYDTLGKLRAVITSAMNSQYRQAQISNWQIVEIEVRDVAVLEVNDVIDPKKLVEWLKR